MNLIHTENKSPSRNVAIFLDWENLVISLRNLNKKPKIEYITRFCEEELGKIAITKAYTHNSSLASRFWAVGVEYVYSPFYRPRGSSRGKSLADIALACDVMKIALTYPWVDTFVLVTGDKDFIPLIRHLKELGNVVILIGPLKPGSNSSTAANLPEEVDKFFWYTMIHKEYENNGKL